MNAFAELLEVVAKTPVHTPIERRAITNHGVLERGFSLCQAEFVFARHPARPERHCGSDHLRNRLDRRERRYCSCRLPATAWREHVYGYTIINDVSARDVQRATSQWSLAKSFPTYCPMGPAIVTADEVADPHQLAISLSIDGETLQNSNTRELIFKIPAIIEYISSITPLLAGRHRLHRNAIRRGHGPHAAALAPTRRNCNRHHRRSRLTHQSRRCRVRFKSHKNALAACESL